MLLFYCAHKTNLQKLHRYGLQAPPNERIRLSTSLAAIQKTCKQRIAVVDALALPLGPVEAEETYVYVAEVLPGAFQNLSPYYPPKKVEAGGGYVVRPGDGEPEVLLIHRRGLWDLPKGKRDKGESKKACALREVREEVGITSLTSHRKLGPTIHGYREPRKKRYAVKTTHWYLMTTPETTFTPQADEGIDAVEWVPWSEAMARIGFTTLRRHMAQVREVVVAAMATAV